MKLPGIRAALLPLRGNAVIALLIAATAVAALLIVRKYVRKYVHSRLVYTRSFSEEGMYEGEEITLIETLFNPTPFPIFFVDAEAYIYDALEFTAYYPEIDKNMQYVISRFNLMPYMKIKRKHTALCKKRGAYRIETAELRSFRLHRYVEAPAELYIYPRMIDSGVKPVPLSVLQGNSISARRLIADPFSFSGIREYRFGDSFSSINFKATAKSPLYSYGSLKVNSCDFCANRNIMVYINFQTNTEMAISTPVYTELMEDALSYAAAVIGEAMREGYRVGLAANCRDTLGAYSIRYEMGSGNAHFTDMLKGLATVRPVIGGSVLRLFEEDCERGLSNTEVYFITTYVSDEICERIAMLERGTNTVSLIRLANELLGGDDNGNEF